MCIRDRILKSDFIIGRGMTEQRLAVLIDEPVRVVNEIVNGKRSITAELAQKFAHVFGTSDQLWLNLQSRHDEAERGRDSI